MKLEEVFPTDPFRPSMKYAGYVKHPFTVPWPPKKRIKLGMGFNTCANPKEPLLMESNAFSNITRKESVFIYHEYNNFSTREHSTSHTEDSSSHMHFSLNASVGGSLLGVSGSGSLEKIVQENKAMHKVSVRGDHTRGQIDLEPLPELGIEARRLLHTADNPMDAFRSKYGDFYVSAVIIGATNFTMLSGGLRDKSTHEVEQAEIDITVLFTVHTSHYSASSSRETDGVINLSAFDSLSDTLHNVNAYSYKDTISMSSIAQDNRGKGINVAKRAGKILEDEFDLRHGQIVDRTTIDKLCDRGLVTELLLMPFTSLRSFHSAMNRPDR